MILKIVPEALQRLDTNEVYWFAIMSIAFRYRWHGTGSFVLIFGLLLLVWLDGVREGGSFLSARLLTTDSS